jgi:hypothetical protein
VKAITLKRPWPAAITHGTPRLGAKRVENRGWKLPDKYIDVPVLLHSGMQVDTAFRRFTREVIRDRAAVREWPDVIGGFVAVVTFTGCHPEADCCGPWGADGAFHWMIGDDVRVLPDPVLCPGRQQFWTPPQEKLDAVAAQMAA